jgi:chromosome segregation ATPase
MNRSILIVICDFLLVSLLAFSTVDINNIATDGSNRTAKTTLVSPADTTKDLTAVMRLALDEERRGRDQLIGELAQTRAAMGKQEALLTERERLVQSREQETKQLQQELSVRERQANQLQREVQNRDQQARRLQQQQEALQQQIFSAQTNIQTLNQQLQAASDSKEKLATMEAEVKKQTEQATAMQQQMNALAQSNQVVLTERQQLQQEVQTREQQTKALQQAVAAREEETRRLEQQLQARELQARLLEQQVQSREQQAALLQQQVQNREEEAKRLQEQQAALLRQFLAAQTNLQVLNQQLQAASTDSVISKERLAAMEAEMKKQTDQAAAVQQQMSFLAQSNQVVLTEKQKLATQLQVAEVETRYAKDQANRMTEEVKIERQEKQKLAEGIQALATKSSELAVEMRVTRPMAPNTIFNEFVTNRVRALFSASRYGWLGNESNRRTETSTILVTDGTNNFALCHVEDTPLSLGYPGVDWEQLIGTLGRSGAVYPIRSISFYLQDPRVVLIPVTAAEAKALGGKVYSIATDPYKFQDAVIVGTRDSYYGECSFQIDLARQKDYVVMDHNSLKGLFGKFNPSRGDLVFSKAGELVGVMANNSYCVMIHSFDCAATFRFGQNVPQHTGEVLSQLYSVVAQLPSKLQ